MTPVFNTTDTSAVDNTYVVKERFRYPQYIHKHSVLDSDNTYSLRNTIYNQMFNAFEE